MIHRWNCISIEAVRAKYAQLDHLFRTVPGHLIGDNCKLSSEIQMLDRRKFIILTFLMWGLLFLTHNSLQHNNICEAAPTAVELEKDPKHEDLVIQSGGQFYGWT